VIIDAHQHVWNPAEVNYPWLGPDFGPINRAIEFDEIVAILDRSGIDRTILVQSADDALDTEYMLALAAVHPEIAAVVGFAPLHDPRNVGDVLDVLASDPIVVGVRNLTHNQQDPDWLLRDDVNRSLDLVSQRGLTFDVLSVLPRPLEHVPVLSKLHPELKMVIDHLATPPIKAGDAPRWRKALTQAAENPRVYAKISGLYPAIEPLTEWTEDDLRPYVEFAVDVFGPDRLMYGGDWPISELAGGYDRVWSCVVALLEQYTAPERDAILAGTAVEFYGIDTSRLPAA
jgi:L-fuconolactonase